MGKKGKKEKIREGEATWYTSDQLMVRREREQRAGSPAGRVTSEFTSTIIEV
jgi:hypothetical protein